MLHLLYMLAFTVLAVLAVSNMLRNLVRLGTQMNKPLPNTSQAQRPVPHPELLDESGDVINEPLLVMRSINIKDARDQLDALYDASSSHDDVHEES
ncbi:MAG: DUF2973 domain-containing protein [Phormidesmis sp. RL_2_1]|nr:DUF2973 domain-containing protein [Phormidesmis sp. RL_2_1]